MRRIMLAVAVLGVLGISTDGQAQAPSDNGVSLSIMGDSVDRRPLHGYDGVIRPGRAENVTTATGNVVVIINGVRITTDRAEWHSGSNAIDIGRNGAARIELPGRISSLRIGVHR